MDPYDRNYHQRPYPPPPAPYGHYDQPPPPHAGGPTHHYAPPPPPFTTDGYAHDHHHHHHRPEEQPYPPPNNPYGYHDQPPPPPPPHVSSFGGGPPNLYPPPPYTAEYYRPPSPSTPSTVHHHTPHVPSIINDHHIDHKTEHENYVRNKPTVRVYSKAKPDFSLTIRDGKVILAPSDPSNPFQHWIYDLKFSTRVKDEEGFPSFALVNKATGEAMKHSVGATYPVQLTKYNPEKLDESVLWSESKDLGDGYRAVRMVNNIRLNVDAFNGDQNHGGVHDGTKIVLWEWKKGDNQRWTMVPY